MQDPTYYVLLAYVQQVDATIDKILSTLQKIHRFDVINEIKDVVSDLIDGLSQNIDGTVIFASSNANLFLFRMIELKMIFVLMQN